MAGESHTHNPAMGRGTRLPTGRVKGTGGNGDQGSIQKVVRPAASSGSLEKAKLGEHLQGSERRHPPASLRISSLVGAVELHKREPRRNGVDSGSW